jgi:hypothetical protein
METIKEKEALGKELKIYKQKEFEDARIKAEKEAEEKWNRELMEIKNASNEYAMNQWLQVKSQDNSDFRYLLLIFLLTSLPIGIGLILKLYTPLEAWLDKIGNYQILIWFVLVIIFIIELFGRSYIFNKEKVKNGWNYFIVILTFKLKEYKINKINELCEEYQGNLAAKKKFS